MELNLDPHLNYSVEIVEFAFVDKYDKVIIAYNAVNELPNRILVFRSLLNQMFYSFDECAPQKSEKSNQIVRCSQKIYTGFTYVYHLYPQYTVEDTVTKVRAV